MARSFGNANSDIIKARCTAPGTAGTIAFRIKPTGNGNDSTWRLMFVINDNGTASGNQIDLQHFSDNNFYLEFYNSSVQYEIHFAAAGIWSAGTWQTWIVTWNSGTPYRAVYVDNVLKVSSNGAFTVAGSQTYLAFGGHPNSGSLSCYGAMCDFVMANAEWDAAERASYQASFTADQIRPSAITEYYPLIGRASPEQNLWSANTGTVTGTSIVDNPRLITPRRRSAETFAGTSPPPPPPPSVTYPQIERMTRGLLRGVTPGMAA